MENKVEDFIERHHLFQEGGTLVVGVSGGPDSMALLHFLSQRRNTYNIQLICCSVDHGLREDSKEEVQFVGNVAQEWGVPFEGISVDTFQLKKEQKMGTQEAARMLRFQVFRDILIKYDSNDLVLAHHGDDQIETMLMKHVRGGTLSGLPIKREFEWGTILRPFLCVTKEEILQYCKKYEIPFCIDPTNEEDDYTRNRFRHHVLPFLKEENPRVHERFQQQSEWLFDDNAYLDQLAEQKLPEILRKKTEESFVLSKTAMQATPVPLQRRILHLILSYLYNSIEWDTRHQTIHIDLLLNWLKESSAPGEWSLPGPVTARTENGHIILKLKTVSPLLLLKEPKKLPIMGHLSTSIGEFKMEMGHSWTELGQDQTKFIADFDSLSLPLTIRFFQSGDRMNLMGQSARKKVSRIFIDHKISKEWRPYWPLVIDGDGQIVWIPLLKRSNVALCNSKTSTFLTIKFSPSKDFGRIM